ncbi:hemolysin-III family protein [Penicillium canescens]|uniref:Hemolysin-III family protein n=1 Tax=Penicillium canescens TaxID=5083 RepID=A0AAD6I868_PENCN|nr:hemolysin-III family protein [Penicillium canescens]KAJ6035562.1 hemolysin-III family protein [Penicillium canescens]KAJ6037685.1 hemolysin-III family protein [Penicillium canescens]KAJ6054311.1 hemolysin-III family protein [Penicillium canescens]
MVSAPRLRVPPLQPLEAHKGREMESSSDTASTAGKAGRPALLSFDEMPEWFRRESNQWILRGYRPISGSAHASFCSWSYIHNESINIYSHLIPAVFFLLGEWYIQQYLTSRYSGVTGADFIAFSIFMLAAVMCLSLSATYHTLMNHSKHMEHLCLRLDMLGIVIFILGDLVLGIYMVFWCEPLPRNIYWSMIGVFGTLTIFMTMHPNFQGPKYRLLRALMFVATGLSGVAPLIHGLNVFGTSQMMRKAFPYTLAKAGCLLSGTSFYATRFPESQYPGKFDLWGSHSIFHILVVCAAVVQLMGYLDAFDYAQANLTCSSL